jgi:hypothetical protein
VLARGEVALLDGALVGEALRALEEQLLTVAATHAADGSGITCHFLSSPELQLSIALQAGWPFVTIQKQGIRD